MLGQFQAKHLLISRTRNIKVITSTTTRENRADMGKSLQGDYLPVDMAFISKSTEQLSNFHLWLKEKKTVGLAGNIRTQENRIITNTRAVLAKRIKYILIL